MIEGITPEIIEIYKQLVAKCPMADNIKELKSHVKMTNNQLDILIRSGAITKFDDGPMIVNEDWIGKVEGGEQFVQ